MPQDGPRHIPTNIAPLELHVADSDFGWAPLAEVQDFGGVVRARRNKGGGAFANGRRLYRRGKENVVKVYRE